jgi:hypothetical protein
VLLLDTPDALTSRWIHLEVDTANAEFVSVLPLVVGARRTTRFLPLRYLGRSVSLRPIPNTISPLSDAEVIPVVVAVEDLLADLYRRRLKLVNRTRSAFVGNGYNFRDIDSAKRMFWSDKRMDPRLPATCVLSHCSLEEPDHLPALRAFENFLKTYSSAHQLNHRVFVYDRDSVLSPAEMESLLRERPFPHIIAHHNELPLLVQSNFTVLPT